MTDLSIRCALRGARLGRALAGMALAAMLVACGGGSEEGGPKAHETAAPARRLAAAVGTASDGWVSVPAPADPLLQGLNIPADAPTRGMWSPVQPWPLNGLHVAVLPDGRVLSFGSGRDGSSQNGRYFDVWNPTAGFTPTSHQTTYRPEQQDSFCGAATYLPDGRLMITGGNGSVTSTLYTPSTDSVATLDKNTADQRWYATLVNLPDGRPIILGGMTPYTEGMQANPEQAIAQGLPSMTPEVLEADGWRSLFGAYSRDAFGPDHLRTSYPRAWVAPDGRVFGISAETMWFLDAAGNGNVTVAGTFKSAPNATTRPNVGATNTAVMFAPGKVLVVGGNGSFNGDGLPASKQATVVDFNTSTPVLTEQPAMSYPRRYPNAVVLADGQVVVTGGTMLGNSNGSNAVYAAEIWNPQTGTWSVGASAAIYRGYHSFTVLLPNGTVLSTGGGAPGPVTNLNAEVYYPPQLFRSVDGVAQLAPRPVIAGISGLSHANGAPLQLDMTSNEPVSQLVLLGTGNGTHSFNAGQRRVPLAFSQDGFRLTATLPDSAMAPPGYYQLVAVDAAGVPSRGALIAIGQGVSPPAVDTVPYNPPPLGGSVDAPVATAGEAVNLSVPATAGASYSWSFGDGSAATEFSASPTASHTYTQPGIYSVTVTARGADGAMARHSFLQAVAGTPTASRPGQSSPIALEARSGAASRLWVVNPDNDSVSVIDLGSHMRLAEIAVGRAPRSVAVAPDGRIWVTNKSGASISVVSPSTLAVVQTIALPRASQPHGLVFAPGGGAYVALEAAGRVVRLDASSGAELAGVAVGPNVRQVSVSADGATLLATRFITRPLAGESTAQVDTSQGGGEVLAIDAATLRIGKTITLRHSDKTDTEIQGSGLPNYLGAAAISPDGRSAWVPSKQDNITRGRLRSGQDLDFQNTVRAISSRLNLADLAEDYARRVDHDNASLASGAAFHPSGAYLFVALETSRQVAIVDAAGGRELLKVDVGRAPQGVASSADGRALYVQNTMDRTLSVIDLSPLVDHGELRASVSTTVPTIGSEKLPAQVLLGKQLFHDARDPRLARDNYMSCASCHADAGHDGRTWDLTGFSEGLRNTIALTGRASLGHGFLHWSANFDEVQDFEKQIRGLAGGTGLMSDEQFNAGTRSEPMGDRKTGLSADLDALAAYLGSLGQFDPTPYRNTDGSLTAAGLAGRAVFQAAACAACHTGPGFTASGGAPALLDIGTLKPASGQRLGGTLAGIDVPTLRDVWATAPYLHDGSAATLAAAVRAHAGNTVVGADLDNLVAYLQQIGAEEAGPNALLLSRGRAATQSSTDYGGVAGRAVDGNTDGVYANNSVTHSGKQTQPWWQVDLGQSASISQVRLWGRTDCCTNRLRDIYVFVSPTDMTGRTLAQLLADPAVSVRSLASLDGAASSTVSFANAGGRFVRVQLDRTEFLSLAEVQVFGLASTLLSQGKATAQSSIGWNAGPERAVDGRTGGVFNDGSVTHTGFQAQPWWQVDLGQLSTLDRVLLWNRTDCCNERLQGVYVFASANDMRYSTLAQLLLDTSVTVRYVDTLGGAASITQSLGGAQARYVGVQLAGSNYLSLAEVQVFGQAAAGGPATPPASSVSCASERQTCTVPPGSVATVWYGASNSWVTRAGVTGSIGCDNTVFGDPLRGVVKSCRHVIDSPSAR